MGQPRDPQDRGPRLADWLPEEAVRALQVEKALHSNESNTALARRLMDENLPTITMSMVHLALHGEPNERLSAGKFLMEACALGKDSKSTDSGKHAWDEVFDSVLINADGFKKNG